jgi:hypothetical protein
MASFVMRKDAQRHGRIQKGNVHGVGGSSLLQVGIKIAAVIHAQKLIINKGGSYGITLK